MGLTLSDDDGATATAATSITVNAVPLGLQGVQIVSAVNAGEESVLHGQICDENPQQSYQLQANWGDGSAPQTVNYPAGTEDFTLTHTYPLDSSGLQGGSYPVALTLTDSDGVQATATTTAVVYKRVELVLLGGPWNVIAGDSACFVGEIAAPEYGMTATVNFGDGSPLKTFSISGAEFTTPSHTYATAGQSYGVSVQVNDPYGPLGTGSSVVNVIDHPMLPDVWITSSIPFASLGNPGQFTVNYLDVPSSGVYGLVSLLTLGPPAPVRGQDFVFEMNGEPITSENIAIDIPPGTGSIPIDVDVLTASAQIGTVWVESNELLPNFGPLRYTQAMVTIVADPAVLSIAPPVAEEPEDSGGTLDFTVSRSGSTAADQVVNYSVGGTAVAGVDYTPLSGTVTIPAGESQATIAVTPLDNLEPEGDKTVVLTLQSSTGATLDPDAQHAAAIIDDDDLPTVSLTGDLDQQVTFTGTGGDQQVTIEAQLSKPVPYAVDAFYTALGTDPADFTTSPKYYFLFPPNTTGPVSIKMDFDDPDQPGPNEKVFVVLDKGFTYDVDTTPAVVTVVNDIPPPATLDMFGSEDGQGGLFPDDAKLSPGGVVRLFPETIPEFDLSVEVHPDGTPGPTAQFQLVFDPCIQIFKEQADGTMEEVTSGKAYPAAWFSGPLDVAGEASAPRSSISTHGLTGTLTGAAWMR